MRGRIYYTYFGDAFVFVANKLETINYEVAVYELFKAWNYTPQHAGIVILKVEIDGEIPQT